MYIGEGAVEVAKKQRDFNADMGAYLDRRKGSSSGGSFSFLSVDSLFSKKSSNNGVPRMSSMETTIVEEKKERKSWFSFLFGSKSSQDDVDMDDLPENVREEVEEVEHDIEEIDHEVEELEEKRAGLFSRLFAMLRMRKPKAPEGDMDPDMVASAIGEHGRNEALIADTRAVLKDMHKWLGRLPPEQIEAFKRSPDFNRYKNLLEEYGLIR